MEQVRDDGYNPRTGIYERGVRRLPGPSKTWCKCGCGVLGYPQPKTGHTLNCFGKCCAKREADKK